jgi:hypothetical protein
VRSDLSQTTVSFYLAGNGVGRLLPSHRFDEPRGTRLGLTIATVRGFFSTLELLRCQDAVGASLVGPQK